jgi:hypothetical protein
MGNCDVPAWSVGRVAMPSSFRLSHFVADDAANGSTADGSNCAAIGKEGAPDGFAVTAERYENPRIPSVR